MADIILISHCFEIQKVEKGPGGIEVANGEGTVSAGEVTWSSGKPCSTSAAAR